MTVRGLKRATQPTRLCFFDAETIGEHESRLTGGEVHRLRLGVMISGRWRGGILVGRKVERFHTATEFLENLYQQLQPKQTLWLIAHNAGFDGQVCGLFDALKRGAFKVSERPNREGNPEPDSMWAEGNPKGLIIHDPPTIVQLADTLGRKLILLDTMNWVRAPLATLGKAVGLPKLPMPRWGDPDSDWFEYCTRDVEILEAWFGAYLEFIEENELGPVRWTASSQAMAAYRYRFLEEPIHSHRIEPIRKLERESYYGGQFRVFKLGEFSGPFYQLDCNSLFPSVMKGREYPTRLARWGASEPWRTCEPKFDPQRSCAEVFIWTDADDYPRRQDGQADPTTGRFRTVLAGEELAHAFDCGHVIAWRKWAEYETAPIFDEFVDALYALRLEARARGDDAWESMAKLLMNSLYGKFAQRGTDMVHRPDICPPIEWGPYLVGSFDLQTRREFSVMAGEAYEIVERKELKHSVPIVSSMIASAARERMRRLRAMVPPWSLFYQSVDSLIVDREGYLALESAGEIDPVTLGKLKVSGESDHLRINGHGWYQIGDRHVLPGRKKEVVQEDPRGYTQFQFEGLKTHLFRPPDPAIFSRKRFVNFPGHFKRGTVNDRGEVFPPHIWESGEEWGLSPTRTFKPIVE